MVEITWTNILDKCSVVIPGSAWLPYVEFFIQTVSLHGGLNSLQNFPNTDTLKRSGYAMIVLAAVWGYKWLNH